MLYLFFFIFSVFIVLLSMFGFLLYHIFESIYLKRSAEICFIDVLIPLFHTEVYDYDFALCIMFSFFDRYHVPFDSQVDFLKRILNYCPFNFDIDNEDDMFFLSELIHSHNEVD